MNQLCKNLESENWNEIYREKDAHDAYNIFYSKLFKWYDKSIHCTICETEKQAKY